MTIPNLDPKTLTERQLQILALAALGCSNPEIGRRLFIAENTVKIHARRAFKLLGVADRTRAVVVAIAQGYLSIRLDDDQLTVRTHPELLEVAA